MGWSKKGSQGVKQSHPQRFKLPARDLLHYFSAQITLVCIALTFTRPPAPQHWGKVLSEGFGRDQVRFLQLCRSCDHHGSPGIYGAATQC